MNSYFFEKYLWREVMLMILDCSRLLKRRPPVGFIVIKLGWGGETPGEFNFPVGETQRDRPDVPRLTQPGSSNELNIVVSRIFWSGYRASGRQEKSFLFYFIRRATKLLLLYFLLVRPSEIHNKLPSRKLVEKSLADRMEIVEKNEK